MPRPDGVTEWHGECPVRLDNGRYFVVVDALLEGRYAIFDTETSELVPFNEKRQGDGMGSDSTPTPVTDSFFVV